MEGGEGKEVGLRAEPKASILLVGGHRMGPLSLRTILEGLGQPLVEVHSGEEALQRMQAEDFAVALLDLALPGMNGLETAKAIRSTPRARRTPILYVSGEGVSRQQLEEGYRLGAVDFLLQPLLPVAVQAKVQHLVESFLDKQRARQEAEQLRLLMEQAPFSIQVLSPDGRTVRVNQAWEELWGITLAGMADYNMLEDQQLEAKGVLTHLRRAFAGETVAIPEIAYDPNETIPGRSRHLEPQRWVSAVAYPLKDEANVVREIILVHEDITARRLTDAALRESEERLRRIVNVDGVGILLWALPEGRLIEANDYFLTMFGYTREEIRATPLTWRDLTPPEYIAISEEQLKDFATTGRVGPYEKEYSRKDGSRAWMVFAGAALGDGTIVEYCIDISDRKLAEAAQRRVEERYRTLFESMDEGYCVIEVIFDPPDSERAVDYRFIEVNPAFEAQAGMQEVTGRRMLEFVPSIESHWLENYGRVALTGEAIRFANEYTGLNRWFEVYAFRVGPPGSHRVGVLFTDITARKQVEHEREELVRRLRAQDRQKDEFLATLAHELRNPLAPIRNGLQIMRLMSGDTAALGEVRTMMERQLSHMVHLVDDLLDLSRISRGKIELRKERVELAKVVQQAVEASRPLLEMNGHDLTITMPPGPVYVDADVTRLAQVFSNLLNNAAKYTDRGGQVHLSVRRAEGEVVVSVKDNGVGIPAHMLPKVFEMFTQVDRHLERSQGGLGIGLSIVKRLVEMHGGSVGVASDGPGQGSEFVIRLPLVLAMDESQVAGESSNSSSNRRKILVVDDNVDAAMSLAMMLTLMGNETKTAHDGLEALDVAEIFQPDLILMDIGMPRLNGHETARRIRAEPWGQNLVLVALTGWGQEDDRRKSEEAGFDSHMTKPIELTALEKLLTPPQNHSD